MPSYVACKYLPVDLPMGIMTIWDMTFTVGTWSLALEFGE